MNWILEHIQIVVAIVAAIAFGLKRARQNADDDEPSSPSQSDEAERTRRIQEEIRRKIAERRGQSVQPSAAPVAPRPVVATPRLPAAVKPALATPSQEAILKRQEELAEQMRLLERARVLEQKRAAEILARKSEKTPAAPRTPRAESLLAELRDPAEVRRAIVLKEILGAPVGLR